MARQFSTDGFADVAWFSEPGTVESSDVGEQPDEEGLGGLSTLTDHHVARQRSGSLGDALDSGARDAFERRLADLVEGVRDFLPLSPGEPDAATIRALEDRLRSFDAEGWETMAFFSPKKPYTRNLLASDEETFALIMMCWNPEVASLVHDHPSQGCWMRVLENAVVERRFQVVPGKEALHQTRELVAVEGQVVYIHDSMGLHSVAAVGGKRAVTLHLYVPPYRSCRVWTGPESSSSRIAYPQFDTVFGERVKAEED